MNSRGGEPPMILVPPGINPCYHEFGSSDDFAHRHAWQNLVCNAAASRLLGGDDQALLWEHAAHFLKGDAPDTAVLTLNGTGAHVAGFEAIKGAEGPVGVRITLRAHKERASTRTSGSITTAAISCPCRPSASASARPSPAGTLNESNKSGR